MPKRIALKDHVMIDAQDLSTFCRAVNFTSEQAQVDVSGFNATGTNEYLSGPTTQSVEFEFFGSYGATEVHATLWPIHEGRQIVPIEWFPDQTAVVSATNPALRGNAQLLTYNSPNATRGDADTFTATFVAADPAGFTFDIVP